MKKEAIKLLKQQQDKITAKDFDLESWKKYTIIILSRIFGDESNKVKQIEKLEYEYSSWSLRDASGNESYEDGTKKLAAEIIQASIDEINAFGIPESESNNTNKDLETILNLILDELKGSQVKQLKSILNSAENDEEKKRLVFEIIGEIGENNAYEVISKIITHKSSKEFFST